MTEEREGVDRNEIYRENPSYHPTTENAKTKIKAFDLPPITSILPSTQLVFFVCSPHLD